eukprot:2958950-Rhodomonas_salina.1
MERDGSRDAARLLALIAGSIDPGLAVDDFKHALGRVRRLASVRRALAGLAQPCAEHEHAEDRNKHALEVGAARRELAAAEPVEQRERAEERALRVAGEEAVADGLADRRAQEDVDRGVELGHEQHLERERADGPDARDGLPHDPPGLLAHRAPAAPRPRLHCNLDRHPRHHDRDRANGNQRHGPVPEHERERERTDDRAERQHIAAQPLARKRLHIVDLRRQVRAQRPGRVLGEVMPPDLLLHQRCEVHLAQLLCQLRARDPKAPAARRVANHLARPDPDHHARPREPVVAHLVGVTAVEVEQALDKHDANRRVRATDDERAKRANEEVQVVAAVHAPHAADHLLVLLLLLLHLLRTLRAPHLALAARDPVHPIARNPRHTRLPSRLTGPVSYGSDRRAVLLIARLLLAVEL